MDERPFTAASFAQFLSERKLMAARCMRCGSLWCPPRSICNKCNSDDMEWIELQGKGKLAAYTCIAVGTSSMIAEGYDRNHPYVSGVVELDEGTRADARIEGVDGTKPETIKIGTPMKVKYLHYGEGEAIKTVLAFEPS